VRKNVARALAGSVLAAAAMVCITAPVTWAQNAPVENTDWSHHPNLAAAQDLSRQAFDKMTAAQEGNEYDLRGQAGNAKDLLRQGNREIKQAAITSNHNGH
jgi:ABC-type uncharacterized transport system substrate-binding protein